MHPEHIGQYKIEKKIGSGGMGTVYLGHHETTGQEVAIKILSATLAQEEGYVARFNREIEALQKLSNPHIVEVYESGIEDGIYYFVMEYIEGETLTMRLRRERKIPWREVIQISLQICSALKSAHDAGIVHRDLKPSNLIITKEGNVKLTDFGIAQVFASSKLTATGGVLGTAEYMSPEQAQGQHTTKKSDLYSLGAVMYAMLAGRPPFTGTSSLDIMQKHRYAIFDEPKKYTEDIPYWLDELVCQLLEKKPEDRIPDALVLSRKLEEVLRKVDLSKESATQKLNVYDGDAPTVDAVSVRGDGDFAISENRGPGAATFMRDIIRHEVSRQQNPTPFSSVLNNTWVLLLLLVFVVGGGFWFFRDRELTPQQKFDAGVAILQEPANSDWIRARKEYFQPLFEQDKWQEKVTPYLKQITQYELQRANKTHLFAHSPKRSFSEPERLMSVAMDFEQRGEISQAVKILKSISVLTKDQPQHLAIFQLATEQLANLQTEKRLTQKQEEFLQSIVNRATQFEKENKQEEARAIWKSLIILYSKNSAASQFVQQAKKHLKE